MVVALKPDFRDGVTETTLECGLEPHADDMEVIDLASKRHAILVSDHQEVQRFSGSLLQRVPLRVADASKRYLDPKTNLGRD